MLWGLSLQFWQTVVFWLWAIAAGTGGIAVAASFGSSIISYYLSEETQTAADREIAKANATAGTANEAAGNAYKRAAELALEVEQERSARLVIEERVNTQGEQVKGLMPRKLTMHQKKAISSIVSNTAGTIMIAQDMALPDIKFISNQYTELFTSSGWYVVPSSYLGIANPPPSGIGTKVADTTKLTKLESIVVEATLAAGMRSDLQPGRQTTPR